MFPLNQTVDAASFESSTAKVEAHQMIRSSNVIRVDPSYSNAVHITELDFGNPVSSIPTIAVEPLAGWNAAANARFKELTRQEALLELDVEEMIELEELTRLRRAARHPCSADEILWQRRQQKLTDSLLAALKAYVEFHQSSYNS